MTTLDHVQPTSHVATRPAIGLRVANAVADFLRAWKNRRAFYQLGEMSDTELADIGLTRADLSAVADLPFGADPTARLGDLAAARVSRSERLVRRRA
jgi:uncharacterized protein YjiS (DUF1127 family)